MTILRLWWSFLTSSKFKCSISGDSNISKDPKWFDSMCEANTAIETAQRMLVWVYKPLKLILGSADEAVVQSSLCAFQWTVKKHVFQVITLLFSSLHHRSVHCAASQHCFPMQNIDFGTRWNVNNPSDRSWVVLQKQKHEHTNKENSCCL